MLGGDVHRRRERVVRRLAHVDVVVRMDGAFLALRADAEAQPLIGQVGDHFVGVRVGRGAGAGLVDVDREMCVVLAGGDFFARGDDRLGAVSRRACRAPGWPARRRPSNSRTRGSPRPARARAQWENFRWRARSTRRTAHRRALASRPSCRVRFESSSSSLSSKSVKTTNGLARTQMQIAFRRSLAENYCRRMIPMRAAERNGKSSCGSSVSPASAVNDSVFQRVR